MAESVATKARPIIEEFRRREFVKKLKPQWFESVELGGKGRFEDLRLNHFNVVDAKCICGRKCELLEDDLPYWSEKMINFVQENFAFELAELKCEKITKEWVKEQRMKGGFLLDLIERGWGKVRAAKCFEQKRCFPEDDGAHKIVKEYCRREEYKVWLLREYKFQRAMTLLTTEDATWADGWFLQMDKVRYRVSDTQVVGAGL